MHPLLYTPKYYDKHDASSKGNVKINTEMNDVNLEVSAQPAWWI